jgi:NAD+ synthase
MDIKEARVKIVDFIADYIERSRASNGVVVGLSGGLDSAVTAALCVEALGVDRVKTISLPYRLSDPSSLEDARAIAQHIGTGLQSCDISDSVDAISAARNGSDRIRLGNICARVRMIFLYDISAELSMLVAGTGNRTESFLGYTTLWGDMACAFTPIGGLLKTQERHLAAEIGLPKWIIEKTPTADLWKDQTDEGEMGIAYEAADKILHAMFDMDMTPDALVAEGFSKESIELVIERVEKYNFKRRMPAFPWISGLPI